ncbi:putative carbamoyl transferase, NodU family [Actinobacteria bacterium IMCC26207]|nr:putative carbamoyl transferase, NodU family [Actinobacteria bacterium IMCC26207]
MFVLGISGLYHDSAAAVLRDGEIVAAAQEERFTRRKHDPRFPISAIQWCLEEAQVPVDGLSSIAYYDKPLSTFSRILRSYAAAGPRGLRSVHAAMSEWLNRKLWTPYEIEKALRQLGYEIPEPLLFSDHHLSHAAAAFYPSPFESAAILTLDGVGEWATSSLGRGSGKKIELLEELRFPNSLGLLYSAFTYQAGFKVNSGEYKLMGLAPYGQPRFAQAISDHLIDISAEGSFTLNMDYFDFLAGTKMTNHQFDVIFGGPPRQPESKITQRECDLARSIQVVLEDVVLRMAQHAAALTGEKNLVLAGGVALNCVANARLQADGPFEEIWVQPAAGDAGSALGAALWAWHQIGGHSRSVTTGDAMAGAQLGPAFGSESIAAELEDHNRPFTRIENADERAAHLATLLAEGNVVGMFQGRMEFGPRALGNRSILADPRSPTMQRVLNEKIKQRESFRPFAPAVMAEHAQEWFELDHESPYMLFTAPVRASRRGTQGEPVEGASIFEQLNAIDSEIPAVTHVDGSARVQTVDAERFPAFHQLLSAFNDLTGCPLLINTSFNVRGEPIVHTPEDAYRCFMTTDMDFLVLEDCVLDRTEQPEWTGVAVELELD